MGKITKTLANCKPSEFLRQTNRLRKSVEKWLTATDIMNLRKKMPEIKDGATEAEKKTAIAEQVRKNMSAMLDTILDEHPDETLELLALMCFVEPENVDDYPISEYLVAISDLIEDEAVISFFSSLVRLGQTNILR